VRIIIRAETELKSSTMLLFRTHEFADFLGRCTFAPMLKLKLKLNQKLYIFAKKYAVFVYILHIILEYSIIIEKNDNSNRIEYLA